MLLICCRTHQNSSPSSLLIPPTIDTANSIGRLVNHHTKRLALKVSYPPQPFCIASHFLNKGDFRDFHFPTLAKLNDDICPFPWINGKEQMRMMLHGNFEEAPILYHGPPPSLAVPKPPSTLILSTLVAAIIALFHQLYFISHSLGNPTTHEWRLVRVTLSNSTALSPSCLQDGRILVEFYTLHHANIQFNAINQRYWLQYYSLGDMSTPSSSMTTHLIWPSDTSKAHAAWLWLVPFCHWINLTHSDTFLHRPFDFAIVNGRKTSNCISQSNWDILPRYIKAFENPLPRFDLPSYSIHVDRGVHVSVCNRVNADALCAMFEIDNKRVYP
jgi:hypothetical protein